MARSVGAHREAFLGLGLLGRAIPAIGDSAALLQVMFSYGININLVLAAFNLLPIPPLDGSHVFKYLLPAPLALRYEALGRYGFVLLFALLWFGRDVLVWWMSPAGVGADALERVVGGFVLPGVVGR